MRDFPLTLPRTIFNIKPAAVSVNLEAEINALIAAAKVTNNLSTTASLNFASTATLVCSDLTIALVGAVVGDVVSLGIPAAAVPAGGSYTA